MANSDYAVKTTLYRRNDSITDTAFLSKGDLRDIDIYRYDCPKVVPDSDFDPVVFKNYGVVFFLLSNRTVYQHSPLAR